MMTSPTIFAQNSVSWFEDWREDGGTTEAAYSNTASAYDNAGKLIVASSVENASGGISLSLKKLGSTGNTIWSKVFNIVQTNKILVGNIAIDDSDNIHIAATMSSGSQTTADALVIKYNTSGVKLWHKTYNNPDNNYDGALDIALMANGDVIATGGSFRTTGQMNLLTMSIGSSGTLLWSNEYNNVGLHETGLKLTLTADTASITGITQLSAFNWEYIQQKILLTDGSTLDANVTDLGAGAINSVMDATQGEDGSYYIAGSVLTDTAGYDMKIIKFDTDFAPVWTATWDSEAHDDDFANAIEVRDNGTVYVTGYTNPADEHIVTLKFDSEGDLVWQKIRPGHGNGVTTNANGTVFVTGYTTTLGNNDFYIGVYDPDGEIIWEGGLNGAANKNDEGRVILVTPEGDIVVIGNSVDEDGDPGSLTAKYGYKTLVLPHGYEEKEVSSPFRENAGQLLDSDGEEAVDIEFYAGGSYPAPFLADDRLSWVFYLTDTSYATPDTAWRVDMSLPDAYLRETKIYGIGQQEYFENYYLAHIPEGKERVRQYQYLLHANAWDNTDLFYEQSGGEMVYRMVCHPGFDQENIRWSVSGYTSMSVNGSGELVIVTPLGDLVLPAPDAWQQDTMGNVITLPWNPYWSVTDEMAYIVMGGSYDTTKVLVVKVGEGEENNSFLGEPWSTYYGGISADYITAVDINIYGQSYFTGKTFSMTFPPFAGLNFSATDGVFNGNADAFISKFNGLGERFWGTFVGGNENNNTISNGNECINDIVCDDVTYQIYFGGNSDASQFPLKTLTGAYNNNVTYSQSGWVSRGFLGRLSQGSGALEWLSYFGNSNSKVDVVTALAISPANTLVVGGYFSSDGINSSNTFPATDEEDSDEPYVRHDGNMYIAEFSLTDLQIEWATQFGNTSETQSIDNFNNLYDLTVDDNNRIFIAGNLADDDNIGSFPLVNPDGGTLDNVIAGYREGFVAKFNEVRNLRWSSFFGGNAVDKVNSIKTNSNGEVFILGSTASDDLPVTYPSGAYHQESESDDIFLARFTNNGSLNWLTYLGGSDAEFLPGFFSNLAILGSGNLLTIDDEDNIIVTGQTRSPDFPVNNIPDTPENLFFQEHLNQLVEEPTDNYDAFVCIFNPDLIKTFATFWGGYNENTFGAGETARCIASYNHQYVLIGGSTTSLNPAFVSRSETNATFVQEALQGNTDGYISKINILTNLPVRTSDVKVFNLKAFPNPTDGLVTINNEFFHFKSYKIYDAQNKYIPNDNGSISTDLIQLNLSNLPPGVYFIQLQSENHLTYQKIIKI